MNNSKKFLPGLFLVLIIVFLILGAILYLAAYFWGFFLILLAGILYFIRQVITLGPAEAKLNVKLMGKKLMVPVVGILCSMILAILIMIITGYDPLTVLKSLFYGGFIRNWHVSVLNATPLIFTGLSIAIGFKAGLFNIGAEGQYYIGTMAATYLGLKLGLPPFLSIVLIYLISASAAAAYNIFPAVLKVKTGAHEVITTMMFAHIARYLSPIFVLANGGDPATSTHVYVTDEIIRTNFLPYFSSFLPEANYRLHIGILIALITAVAINFFLNRSKYGYEIRAVGANADAARAQGISVGRNIILALVMGGFLAGMAGVTETLGLNHKMFQNLDAGYGFNGISVALLAGNHPIGIIFTSLLWGALDAGGQYMSRTTGVPGAIVEIIKGMILFLIVAKYIYSWAGNRLVSRRKARAEEGLA
ncbi:MAG: ABC transporter permease [Spirochaetales bacterium]|jgi:simple sugar transport system permease protein|nr:ABC transporter permease [Spirochaetales bacterium]